MKIVYSNRFLEHEQGFGHPECAERLITVKKYLESKSECEFIAPTEMGDNERRLLFAHSQELIEKLKRNSANKASFPDNRFSENTFEIAKLAAHAACDAASIALTDEFAFALVRPPGHHAGRDSFGGFCYLNNVAVAVRSLQAIGKKRAAIIDIDFHHGNGTQDIFYNDKSVFYLSLHADPRIAYPGTGFESENNEHILNIPLPLETDDEEYLERLKNALSEVRKFNTDAIAISVGFDTFYLDPIAGLGIRKSETYHEIGKIINELFECPKFGTLEGGYYIPKLGENCYNFLMAFR
jgi:acetoin utilization deacetylase AcuC-like enzyme